MVREYVNALYVPAAQRYRRRTCDDARLARELARWSAAIEGAWRGVSFGSLDVCAEPNGFRFTVAVDLGVLEPSSVRVELYADSLATDAAVRAPMELVHRGDRGRELTYSAFVDTARPASHFTPRVVPFHSEACVPAESQQILWQR
jgi:starch phosphorylase